MTGDFRLRGVTEDDLLIFFVHQLDLDANRMAAFPSRDREAFMAHWSKILGDKTVTTKTILLNGHVAGNILSWVQSGERDIGYWIGREYWGRGAATNALSEFLRLEKERPLYAHVAKHNIASLRVLEKCGFTISGEARVPSDVPGEEVEELILRLTATENDRLR